MTAPFTYPAAPHERRHGPAGYADYESYRPWLRDEFAFRCVFCLTRETWGPVHAHFAIDHFLPVMSRSDGQNLYENLLYSCVSCNNAKGARLVPDPLVTLVDGSVRVDADGTLRSATTEAAHLIDRLDLNLPRKIECRAQWIAVVGLSQRLDPELHRRLLGYPSDLPDLARLRPPAGNARSKGVTESHHERRARGELPGTY